MMQYASSSLTTLACSFVLSMIDNYDVAVTGLPRFDLDRLHVLSSTPLHDLQLTHGRMTMSNLC